MRTIIYIDGFNLYYGCLKGAKYKWLDVLKLFQIILAPENEIVTIKYFTAVVKPTPNDPSAPQRQNAYFNALKAHIPCIEIINGFFLRNKTRMANANPPPTTVEVWKTEEKGSDVNLAIQLLNDAWLDKYDCGIVVSNDSDMAESMRMIRLYHPKKILGLVTPGETKRTSEQLRKHAHFIKKIRNNDLAKAQLPNPVLNGNIPKPKDW